jgi:hypothetical protein
VFQRFFVAFSQRIHGRTSEPIVFLFNTCEWSGAEERTRMVQFFGLNKSPRRVMHVSFIL